MDGNRIKSGLDTSCDHRFFKNPLTRDNFWLDYVTTTADFVSSRETGLRGTSID